MSGSARVISIEAIERFRLALIKFNDHATRSVMAVDEQTKRVMHWFEHEAPVEWNVRIRQCYGEVSRKRAELETCRMRKVGDNRPACIEEKEALRAAQRKLAEAQEMLDVVRMWANRVRQATDDYRGGVMGFRNALEVTVPESIAMLARTIRALDAYAEKEKQTEEENGTKKGSQMTTDEEQRERPQPASLSAIGEQTETEAPKATGKPGAPHEDDAVPGGEVRRR